MILSAIALAWVILLTRVVGLRSFSKMTNFDFVMTIATGSLLAGAAQATKWPAFAQALIAITALFVVQFIVAKIRKKSDGAEAVIENTPILLMRDGEFIDAAMEESRVARSDVIAKLREANALDLKKVRAVVLETTGDVSVLHGPNEPDDILLDGVERI